MKFGKVAHMRSSVFLGVTRRRGIKVYPFFQFLCAGVESDATRNLFTITRSDARKIIHRRPRMLTRDLFAVPNLVLTLLWTDANRPNIDLNIPTVRILSSLETPSLSLVR